jgi:hypothetical protein
MKIGDKVVIAANEVLQDFVNEIISSLGVDLSSSGFNIVFPDRVCGTIVDIIENEELPYVIQFDDFGMQISYNVSEGYFKESELELITE